eukprot:CAMPEP_0202979006 /NCGR_PEP_ID=MMETSP1396-20130829/85277_1 /ASSEMBLY_ACC=CAM_ASM_000872 /TAXON_ID= /ORGANISM="Pseudokeronopsis sp., Strain Brazil" /LENGTH=35 /DNA_ID= /DNA_START= /DNA_END= /DNA_ORIENTATION=
MSLIQATEVTGVVIMEVTRRPTVGDTGIRGATTEW